MSLVDTLIADAEKILDTEVPANTPKLFAALAKRLEQALPEIAADALAPPEPPTPGEVAAAAAGVAPAPVPAAQSAIQTDAEAGVAAGAHAPSVGSPTAAEDAATIANLTAETERLKQELAAAQSPPSP